MMECLLYVSAHNLHRPKPRNAISLLLGVMLLPKDARAVSLYWGEGRLGEDP